MMTRLYALIDSIPLSVLLLASATLGLAPFTPEPHIVEKLRMLMQGTLSQPIDIFDLALHATPFLLLAAKLLRMGLSNPAKD